MARVGAALPIGVNWFFFISPRLALKFFLLHVLAAVAIFNFKYYPSCYKAFAIVR